MKHATSALERVHALYLLQTKLLAIGADDLKDPETRRTLRCDVREFEELLDEADWRYMGGEDVLESLKQIPGEVTQLLKIHAPTNDRRPIRNAKKSLKRKK